jgi:hypothetical protein
VDGLVTKNLFLRVRLAAARWQQQGAPTAVLALQEAIEPCEACMHVKSVEPRLLFKEWHAELSCSIVLAVIYSSGTVTSVRFWLAGQEAATVPDHSAARHQSGPQR